MSATWSRDLWVDIWYVADKFQRLTICSITPVSGQSWLLPAHLPALADSYHCTLSNTVTVIVLPKWMKVILKKITPGLWYSPSLKSDTWCWWEKPTNPTKSTDGWREQLVGQSCCSHCGNKNAASVQLFFLPPAFMKKFRKKKKVGGGTDQRLKQKLGCISSQSVQAVY